MVKWVIGLNPISFISGDMKGIRPQLLLCSEATQSQDPLEKSPIQGLSQGM